MHMHDVYTHTHTYTHIYTMEYYSAIKYAIPPFITNWMYRKSIQRR